MTFMKDYWSPRLTFTPRYSLVKNNLQNVTKGHVSRFVFPKTKLGCFSFTLVFFEVLLHRANICIGEKELQHRNIKTSTNIFKPTVCTSTSAAGGLSIRKIIKEQV